jgi:hypothetical protein
MPCTSLNFCWCFGGTYRLHLPCWRISQARNQHEACSKPKLGLWRWRRYVPPNHQLTFNGLHGVISQKTEHFITTGVRTSDPTIISLFIYITSFFFTGSTALVEPDLWFFSFVIILQKVGLLGRLISSSQGLYLNTEQHKHRINTYTYQTSMLCVGFEPVIPASERVKTARLQWPA